MLISTMTSWSLRFFLPPKVAQRKVRQSHGSKITSGGGTQIWIGRGCAATGSSPFLFYKQLDLVLPKAKEFWNGSK